MSLFDDETASLLVDARNKMDFYEEKRLKIEEAKLDLEREKLSQLGGEFERKQKESSYVMSMIENCQRLSNEFSMPDARILELFPDMGRLNIVK